MEDSQSAFLRWNDGIAGHFFKAEVAGQPVVLFVNESVLEEVGDQFGSGPEDFVQAVKAGPPWLSGYSEALCRKALYTMRGWRARDLPSPPYIAYLALFVYAAGVSGNFAEHAYYPRLRKLLGLPHGSTLPGFDRMLELWDDLEQWAVVDRRGELGLFEARITGKWIHVGVPLAQTVLSAEERVLLPGIFAEANLDPEAIPTNSELAQTLRTFGASLLRHRTLTVLQNEGDEMYDVLLDTVVGELMTWDGKVEVATEEIGSGTYSSLKLCLELEPLSSSCSTYLRATLPDEFPKSCTLIREAGDLPQRTRCTEDVPGWSMPLVDEATSTVVDASTLDWTWSKRSVCPEENMMFRFQNRPVRIFADAQAQSLPGYIESHSLPGAAPFLIAVALPHRDRIVQWLNNECVGARQIWATTGIPADWELWSAEKAAADTSVRRHYPWLRLPDSIRLRFRGGVHSSAGNYYFAFAPPDVEVTGYTGSEELTANSSRLDVSAQGIASLQSLGYKDHVQLEVRKAREVISRRSLFFVVSLDFDTLGPCIRFNEWGRPASSEDLGRASGALTEGVSSDSYRYRYPFEFDEHQDDKLFIIGPNPGEICIWPQEALPDSVSPQWAVRDALKADAVYIGPEYAASGNPVQVTRDRVKMWKNVLWHRRCRIAPPRFINQRRQWQQLQRSAEHVRAR